MYNVELYIDKCLTSCIKQDIQSTDYEIIVINDGSLDNSLQIAENIASKTNNIQIFSQPNSGLSIARNKGLSLARGQYVWFVDSDDWITENCLKDIVKNLEDNKPDLLQLQYRECFDNIKLDREYYCKLVGIVSGKQQILNGGVPIPAPFAIYRRDFLTDNNLRFYPGIFHEDCEFKPKVLYLAKRCCSHDKVVYNYYQRTSGSITTVANPKRAFDYLKVTLSINDFYYNIANGECACYFHNHIALMINNALSVVGEKEKEFSKELYNKRFLFIHLLNSSILKYRIEGLLFYLFPQHSTTIYKLLQTLK